MVSIKSIEPISYYLEDLRIIKIEKIDDDHFELTEMCDQNFSKVLKKEAFLAWIEELRNLVIA